MTAFAMSGGCRDVVMTQCGGVRIRVDRSTAEREGVTPCIDDGCCLIVEADALSQSVGPGCGPKPSELGTVRRQPHTYLSISLVQPCHCRRITPSLCPS